MTTWAKGLPRRLEKLKKQINLGRRGRRKVKKEKRTPEQQERHDSLLSFNDFLTAQRHRIKTRFREDDKRKARDIKREADGGHFFRPEDNHVIPGGDEFEVREEK